jgi:hypothetical protein
MGQVRHFPSQAHFAFAEEWDTLWDHESATSREPHITDRQDCTGIETTSAVVTWDERDAT